MCFAGKDRFHDINDQISGVRHTGVTLSLSKGDRACTENSCFDWLSMTWPQNSKFDLKGIAFHTTIGYILINTDLSDLRVYKHG